MSHRHVLPMWCVRDCRGWFVYKVAGFLLLRAIVSRAATMFPSVIFNLVS